jgi:hypothetical protein
MGKSSPTKLQLKHIPDVVIMQTVYTLQNTWTVWVGAGGGFDPLSILDVTGRSIAARSLSYRQKKTAHLAEICEVLRPLPEKLVWRKLQKLEARGWLYGHGPSGVHYAVTDEYWAAKEAGQ